MLKKRRFTPAMIVAMIALAVALSGTAVAGTAKLITGSQIANGTIKLADIHSSAKTALKGKPGATGAQGPAGAQGPGRAAGRHRREGRRRVPSALPEPRAPRAGLQGLTGHSWTAHRRVRLTGDFSGSNASVATTLDGVQFGPYSNGGTAGGSVAFAGVDGLTLAAIDAVVVHGQALVG